MTLRSAFSTMMRAVSPHAGVACPRPDAPGSEKRGRKTLRDTAASVQTAADKITAKATRERDVMSDFIHGIYNEQQRELARRGD